VRDITSNSDSTVTVSFTARIKGKESSSYVRIPDVDSETLQFGDCYIAPKTFMHKQKYIKTVRFLHTEQHIFFGIENLRFKPVPKTA
jgi:hypothetical protein